MPEREKGHLLRFHCGVCAKRLTDAGALFTSCGHFFCASSSTICTRLRTGNGAGRCEQCGQNCDAGVLAEKGERYDKRVQEFVFSEPAKNLRRIAEILDFQDAHLGILRENMVSQATRIGNLKAEYKSQSEEMIQLRIDNEALHAQIARLKTQPPTAPRAARSGAALRPKIPSLEVAEGSETAGEPFTHVRRRKSPPAKEGSRFSRDVAPLRSKPRPRPPERQDRWAPRPSAAEWHAPRSDVMEARGSKRKWMEKPVESVVAGSRARGVAGASSKATRITGLSRFARRSGGAVGSGASTVGDGAERRQSRDWQHRVSSIPRPSVTQDRMAKRPIKRSRPAMW